MDLRSPEPVRTIPRLKSGFLIITALACASLGWFILNLLPAITEKLSGGTHELPSLVRFCIRQRTWIPPLTALPGFLCGVILLRNPRLPFASWWLVGGKITLFLSVGLIIFCFVRSISPAYQ